MRVVIDVPTKIVAEILSIVQVKYGMELVEEDVAEFLSADIVTVYQDSINADPDLFVEAVESSFYMED